MFRLKNRSIFFVMLIGAYSLIFAVIGPCSYAKTQEEVTFLARWAERLPQFHAPTNLSYDQTRAVAEAVEAQLRADLDELNRSIAFELPEEMQIPENSPYPIMFYRSARKKSVDKISNELADRVTARIPFPREPTGNMNRNVISKSLRQLHVLDKFVSTFRGFSFSNIKISDAKPVNVQRISCQLIGVATQYTIQFGFTSSLEEALRWVDRLRNEDGFFFLERIRIVPSEVIPGAVDIKTQVTSVNLEPKKGPLVQTVGGR